MLNVCSSSGNVWRQSSASPKASHMSCRRCTSIPQAVTAAVHAHGAAGNSTGALRTSYEQHVLPPNQQQQQLHELQALQAALQEDMAQQGVELGQQHLPHTRRLEEQLLLQMQASPLYHNQQQHQQHEWQSPASMQHDVAAAHLSASMKRAHSWQELAQLVQTYTPTPTAAAQKQQQQDLELGHALKQLNPQHLACLLSSLAKLQPAESQARSMTAGRRAPARHRQQQVQQQFEQFTRLAYQQVLQQLPVMGPREVSTVLWAASKLRQPPAALQLKQLLAHVTQAAVVRYANAQDVSMCLYAAAALGLQVPEQQIEALLGAAAAQQLAAAPQAIANILWAVATLQYRPHEQWLQQVEKRCCTMLQHQQQHQQQDNTAVGFTSKGLHQLLWAMAKLQWLPEERFQVLFWAASGHQLPYMSPHGTTGLLWAAASLQLRPPEQWMQVWFDTTQQQLAKGEFGDQDVSNALWGLVRLGMQPSASWLGVALEASAAVLAAAGSQELAVTLWGWAKLGVKPPQQWMLLWMTSMSKRMGSYCAPALASSAYSLAVLRYKPPRPWCELLVAETQRQMAAFGAQELSNLIWALAVLGVRPCRLWLRDFEQQVLDESGSFNAQELSLVCWSLVKLGHKPPVELVTSLLSEGLELQGGLAGQSVMLLMVSLVKWDYPQLKEAGKFRMLLPRYWAACQQLLPNCNVYQLSMLWWARAQLGCMPNASWSHSFWEALTPTLAVAVQAVKTGRGAAAHTPGCSTAVQIGSIEGQPGGAAVHQGAAADASGSAAAAQLGSTGGQPSGAAVQRGAAAVHLPLSPAAIARLIWATGKMGARQLPDATARLLLQAAELVLPLCGIQGVTQLGIGILHVNKAAARSAVQIRAAARSRGLKGPGAQQHRAACGMFATKAAVLAGKQQAAFWLAWFAQSTHLLAQDARVAAQRRMQQQQGQLSHASQGFGTLQQHQCRLQQQYRISGVDLTMQLSIAAHLRLRPPSSWTQVILAACTVYLESLTLKQVTWVVWAVVRLQLGSQLPPGWLQGVLRRAATELSLADCGLQSSTVQTCMLRLRAEMEQLRSAGLLQQPDWQLWYRMDKHWQCTQDCR